MTPKWDAHINGYFPTSTSQQTGSAEYADTFGVYNYMNPIVGTHDEYDAALAPNAVIGDGADAEIGYSFDSAGDKLRTRVSLGAYYYQAPSKTDVDNIAGLIVGFSKALTRNLSVSMANSYDQVMHYNVNMSLTLTFGGDSNTFSGDVSDRLLDSVQRHVGILATGAGQYDQQDLEIQLMQEGIDKEIAIADQKAIKLREQAAGNAELLKQIYAKKAAVNVVQTGKTGGKKG